MDHADHPSYVCAACGDRIGVYEPIWIRGTDGSLVTTSLLNLADDTEHPPLLWHAGCLTATSFAA